MFRSSLASAALVVSEPSSRASRTSRYDATARAPAETVATSTKATTSRRRSPPGQIRPRRPGRLRGRVGCRAMPSGPVQAVADPADRLDHRRMRRIVFHLGPQPPDGYVHQVRLAEVLVIPHPL